MTQMTQNFNPVIHIQKDSKDATQWDCSEMVGCVSQRSFELMLQTQPSKNVTVHKFTWRKNMHVQVGSGGGAGHNF